MRQSDCEMWRGRLLSARKIISMKWNQIVLKGAQRCASTLLLLCLSLPAHAAAPALFFSDLDSGPKTGGENNKGAYVCVWGRNFGATQGSSYITVGGGVVDHYPVWTDATGNPSAPNKACFQLGSDALSGNILMITPDGTSNGLPFTVRPAGTSPDGIWCLSPTGSDSNNGNFISDGSGGSGCKATWSALKDKIAPGDIVYFMDGFTATNSVYGGGVYASIPAAGAGSPEIGRASCRERV